MRLCSTSPTQLTEETVFSPLYILASFAKDKVSIGVWIYLWAFYFVPLIHMSVFVPVPYCLDDCSFVVEPEVRQVDSSNSMFLSQDCFGYLRFFVLPYKLYHWYFKFILFFNLVLSPSLSFLVSWLIMSFVFFTFFVDLFFILLECIFHWHFLKLGGKNIFSNWMSQISFFLQV